MNEANDSRRYADAIGQLLQAAERARDPKAWLTFTTLAEMFVRLDQQHQASGADARVKMDGLYPVPRADKLS